MMLQWITFSEVTLHVYKYSHLPFPPNSSFHVSSALLLVSLFLAISSCDYFINDNYKMVYMKAYTFFVLVLLPLSYWDPTIVHGDFQLNLLYVSYAQTYENNDGFLSFQFFSHSFLSLQLHHLVHFIQLNIGNRVPSCS